MEIYFEEVKNHLPDCFERYFKMIKNIDNGSFGVVVHAIYLDTKQEVAVKIINKDKQRNLSKLIQEILILQELKHPNIVEFYNYIETENKFYVIMEYIGGAFINDKTAQSIINVNKDKSFREEEVACIIKNLLSAIDYIHAKDIVHRDIKPDNILLGDKKDFNKIKLIDFGLSAQYFEDNKEMDFCGTLIYMPPEQIGHKIYSRVIDNI